ncbi:polycystin-1 isoform X2 [Hippocampus zosterae]|uniref:polycystin-1 isoform X2 n=1 Tax=Hippocampus zosterae TaxID=109293 RepID=UPI00223E6BF8|nr:polycystin-1 isoform X2 [Hippocampus zosterae]
MRVIPTPRKQAWKIIFMLLISTSRGRPAQVSSCPEGAHVHLPSLRCFWLSEKTSTWSEALASCQRTRGGCVAVADTLELQSFLHHFFPVKKTEWVWIRGVSEDIRHKAGFVESTGPPWRNGGRDKHEVCTQMALGMPGQWRTISCAKQYHFFCQNDLTDSLPEPESYVVGIVLITGVFQRIQIAPLATVPDVEQLAVEMQLFPGLWFSHAGQVTSLELVVQPSSTSSSARIQILRPYCNPNYHLVPPGCSSLMNPFSCCSTVPLCNTTGGCGSGQYWCHILETCLANDRPCSPYTLAAVERGFALPPRYPATAPLYHLVADIPLKISPVTRLQTLSVVLPEGAVNVYPDDIVAVQHTRDRGAFLRCLASEVPLNSPWRQSYLSLLGTTWGGWWQGGLTVRPQGEHWVDGVVCDLRLLYEDTLNGARTEQGRMLETTTPSDAKSLTRHVKSTFGLRIIHPPLDEKNQIHLALNVPTLIVVTVLSGEKVTCSWSSPVLRTGLPFGRSCPEDLTVCKTHSEDVWFSSVTLVSPSVGVQMLNISVADAVRSQTLTVTLRSYEAVSGLSVEPRRHQRTLVDVPQSFTAQVVSGSSVTFSWVIDNLEAFADEGESYSVVFKKPAEYKLKVTASNPVSSQSMQLLLTADEMKPLSEPEFMYVRQVVAVGAPHLFTLRVKVDIALPTTFRWDFGDGSSGVLHTVPAPYDTMEMLAEKGETQVFVRHSVNFTYTAPGNYDLHVGVSTQYEEVDKSIKISVRHLLKRLFLNSSALLAIVNETYLLEAFTDPAVDNVIYTWNFGDQSKAVQCSDPKAKHTFRSAGAYNITLCANNTLSILTSWLVVEVLEKITGLSVSCNGPCELGSVTNCRATVATGTRLIWDFDFGDGSEQRHLADGSVSQIYKFQGNYTVRVNVSNSVSEAHQSISVVVYRLAVIGVMPTECVMTGRNTEFSALLNGNVSVLVFNWLFGEGTPATVVTGRSAARHTFSSPGIFHVSLTVKSSLSTASYNSTVCVQTAITDILLRPSQDTAAAGDEICFSVLFSPEQRTSCQFKWLSSASIQAAVTEHSQQCFTFRDEGIQKVFVTASNNVSSKTASASIAVQRPVSNFSLAHANETVTVNTSASFWVASCTGSNVSVFWVFGDGSPTKQQQNVSHVFTTTGDFTVTATAFNAISRESASLKVRVLHPVSDFSLQTKQPFSVVGEETFITAVSNDKWTATYYWTVDGLVPTQEGTREFRFVFREAGQYQVRCIARNLVSRREAVILVEVFERIEGLHMDCPALTNMTYLPTQEDVVFVASVTKGSNVTYKWLATPRKIKHQIPADGERFQLVVETPGLLTIQLNASNMLGESTGVASFVAVERVTDARITAQTNIAAVGKFLHISVSVLTGSDLKYFWYVDSELACLETDAPFFRHKFTSSGDCLVKVLVQNTISRCGDTKIFTVQEEVKEASFQIGGKMFPFHLSTNTAVPFQGVVRQGSHLHWDWKVSNATTAIFSESNAMFTYTFLHEGVYGVSLNVSNAINWQQVTHRVIVQDRIEGLTLNVSRDTLCTREEVTFTPAIRRGSNASFVLMFETKDWKHRQDVVDGFFTTLNLPAGTHVVQLTAWNQVSSAQMSTRVQIFENVTPVKLLTPDQHAIEALKEVHFEVDDQNEFSVNYTWIFHLEDTEPLWLKGKTVIFTPSINGSLLLSVLASNGVCSKMLNKTLTVEWPVKEVQLLCHSEPIFAGHVVLFSAKINGGGSNLRYAWSFGNSVKDWPSDLSTVNHTFDNAGLYIVLVNVSNGVSQTSAQLRIDVVALRCSSPQASLIQNRPTIFRSRVSFFEASVAINCSAYKATYQWEMFRASDCTDENLDLTGKRVPLNGTTSPFLHLPKRSLDVGQYCLFFTLSFQGTPLLVRRKTEVTVVSTPSVAVIKGGSRRLWPSTLDLVLDGSGSQDPDADQGEEDAFQYRWTVTTENSTVSIESDSSIVTVPRKQLNPDTIYAFTLIINKMGKTPASFTQTVTVCEALQLPVFVEWISCPGHACIILSGHCGECDDHAQYSWSAEDETGARFDLDKAAPSARKHSPKFMLPSDALLSGHAYTFTLNVTLPGSGRWGSASQTVVPHKPPDGGRCELHPESHVHPLGTVVTFNCTGWSDDESISSGLIYTFQVAPCHPVMCPLFTLYKGTRSTFGSLVPVGIPVPGQSKSLITVILIIEDNLGSSVVALNRTLSVQSHGNVTEWLRTKSQKDMWAFVQHGNPQEIIPYSIALTSQLNQMASGQSTGELNTKKEIRENVTKALLSLPVSSMMDVDQISSALVQSTAVPAELICMDCQEKVLEAIGKMIHVMQEHKSPAGGVSVFDTGKNILRIVGSSLASASISTFASNTQHNYSRTLQAASVITLSAISQAGALMRSLMHSPGPGEVPLSFVTPHISTAGFYGDPSNLLCSKHAIPSQLSTPPCPFQIPVSLTAHLKSQRSELAQVIFGLDESNALLAAADPPISTSLVAMEITTPQGEPIPVQDLEPDQAIRVTLQSKFPAGKRDARGDGRVDGHTNGTCTTVPLPLEQCQNFTIRNVGGLDENTGLYISFNFSLLPGVTSETAGHVKIKMTSGSQDSLTKEWIVNLSPRHTFTEKTIFLSPLLNRTAKTLSLSLTSFEVQGGPVAVSICVFSSLCQYYSLKGRTWSSEGLKPLEGTTLQTVHCLTHHLTMFGASLFLHPGAVVLLPPAADPSLNVMVAIVCAVLILTHLLVGLIAHKLDHLDGLRLSQVPLCGREGPYHYRVLVKTGWRHGAGTTAHVGISLYGVNKSGSRHLQRVGAFQRGGLDQFHLETDVRLGEVWKIRIWHDNTGLDPSWYVQHVVVWDPVTDHMFFFLVEDWLSVENPKNGTVEKEILASCPEELSQFRRILYSQLIFGMVEHHLWLSLWERPIHSVFTRAQRVTCSALMLHLYLASGALWYGAVGTQGHNGPVSAKLLFSMETVAVGMVVAVLLFPLQCLICFLFRKSQSQVIVDMSVPSSPVCYSVEMDVYLGQTELSGPSFLSLSGPSSRLQDSPSSLLESKGFDSSILDFWAASGLVPQTDDICQEETATSWASCDSLLKESEDLELCDASLALCATRQLRRKKARMQLHLTPRASSDPPAAFLHPLQKDIVDYHSPIQEQDTAKPLQAQNHNMKNFLTLSEENLLMSIEEATEDTLHFSKNNSDSGRDSPTTTSSFSNTQSTSCSSWWDYADDKYHREPEYLTFETHSGPSQCEAKLYRCPSVLSVDSVASTFLPSPSPDSTRCSSTTRIGIARGRPSWLLPPWVLCVIYPLVAAVIAACLVLVGIYGSFFSRTVVLMWLVSALSAFLASALLLEPLKVCIQALICTAIWRPVDPEVEDQLARETTVARSLLEEGGKVRPPCGYGLLQAKEEARKVRALKSLMRHCAFQLLFLLLVLMVNYQDSVERRQGRQLHLAVGRQLHTAPLGSPNLTSIRNCLDAGQWMNSTLVTNLHQNPLLRLVGSPRLLYAHTLGQKQVTLGNSSMATHQALSELLMGGVCMKQLKSFSLDFTQYHRESRLCLCLSIQLDFTQRITSSLSIYPLLIPSSHEGLDLHLVLTVFLLGSALLILIGELRSMASERAQYPSQGKHWLQLLLAALSLATSVLHLCFRAQSTSCVSQLRTQPDSFVNFHGAARLAQKSSQCAAVLLTFLVLKLLGTLRFVRRWVVIIRVLNRAWKELWTLSFLLMLLILFSTHLGKTLFSQSVEGFLSMHQVFVSLMSIVRGRLGLQRLCRVHPVLGPLYGSLLTGAGVWLLAKFFGAVLIRAYRAEKADIYRPAAEPQDYEMVEFFIKRLKLWIGLRKAKEFRHRVKFEGMDVPPSRASRDSRLSTLYSSLPSSHSSSFSSPSFSSPRPLSSSLSVLSEDSALSEQGFDVQPFLDHLLPCVNALLSQFDRVTQITEDLNNLEIELEDILSRRRKKNRNKETCEERFQKSANPKDHEGDGRPKGEVRRRRTGLLYTNPQNSISAMFPFTPSTIQPPVAPAHLFQRTRNSHSESESVHLQYHASRDPAEAAKPTIGNSSLHPVNSPGLSGFPKRRAWHSGSSHSADAAQRLWLKQGGVAPCGSSALPFVRPNSEEGIRRRISDGAPKKRKAWISEGPS